MTSSKVISSAPVNPYESVVCTPHNGTLHAAAAHSRMQASRRMPVPVIEHQASILTHAFNAVWCQALNMRPRPRVFSMHHSDVAADDGWLDKLTEILDQTGADVVSAAIAIKDSRGFMSTAVLDPATGRYRNVTAHELQALPETFGVEDVPWAPEGAVLCANSGLWVCRVAPWCEKICFHNQDAIVRDDEGMLRAAVWPEDYNFSLHCHQLGKRVLVTRAVEVEHYGLAPFSSNRVWGSEEAPWVPTGPLDYSLPGGTP